MRGWLIYTKEDATLNKSYIEWFIEEGKRQGITIEFIEREHLTVGINDGLFTILWKNKHVQLPEFVVVRTIEPLLQRIFEAANVFTFNPFSVAQITNNKSLTYIEMQKLHIPIVPTYFIFNRAFPKEPPIAYPFVAKEATGRGGRQVYYIKNEQDWQHVQRQVMTNEIIVQEANVQLGRDLRVFVIGKKIVSAVLRSNDNDFRANFTLGASAQLYPLNRTQRQIVQKIIDHFEFGMVGIDFLISHDGSLIFNEIEDVVGSRILSATSNINLLEHYVSHIKEIVQQHIILTNH